MTSEAEVSEDGRQQACEARKDIKESSTNEIIDHTNYERQISTGKRCVEHSGTSKNLDSNGTLSMNVTIDLKLTHQNLHGYGPCRSQDRQVSAQVGPTMQQLYTKRGMRNSFLGAPSNKNKARSYVPDLLKNLDPTAQQQNSASDDGVGVVPPSDLGIKVPDATQAYTSGSFLGNGEIPIKMGEPPDGSDQRYIPAHLLEPTSKKSGNNSEPKISSRRVDTLVCGNLSETVGKSIDELVFGGFRGTSIEQRHFPAHLCAPINHGSSKNAIEQHYVPAHLRAPLAHDSSKNVQRLAPVESRTSTSHGSSRIASHESSHLANTFLRSKLLTDSFAGKSRGTSIGTSHSTRHVPPYLLKNIPSNLLANSVVGKSRGTSIDTLRAPSYVPPHSRLAVNDEELKAADPNKSLGLNPLSPSTVSSTPLTQVASINRHDAAPGEQLTAATTDWRNSVFVPPGSSRAPSCVPPHLRPAVDDEELKAVDSNKTLGLNSSSPSTVSLTPLTHAASINRLIAAAGEPLSTASTVPQNDSIGPIHHCSAVNLDSTSSLHRSPVVATSSLHRSSVVDTKPILDTAIDVVERPAPILGVSESTAQRSRKRKKQRRKTTSISTFDVPDVDGTGTGPLHFSDDVVSDTALTVVERATPILGVSEATAKRSRKRKKKRRNTTIISTIDGTGTDPPHCSDAVVLDTAVAIKRSASFLGVSESTAKLRPTTVSAKRSGTGAPCITTATGPLHCSDTVVLDTAVAIERSTSFLGAITIGTALGQATADTGATNTSAVEIEASCDTTGTAPGQATAETVATSTSAAEIEASCDTTGTAPGQATAETVATITSAVESEARGDTTGIALGQATAETVATSTSAAESEASRGTTGTAPGQATTAETVATSTLAAESEASRDTTGTAPGQATADSGSTNTSAAESEAICDTTGTAPGQATADTGATNTSAAESEAICVTTATALGQAKTNMNGDEPLIALDPRQAARVKPTGKADDHGHLIGTACESEVVAAPRSQSSETNVSTKLAINVYATNYSDASTLVPTDYDNRYGTSRIDNLRQSVIEDDTFNQVAMNVCATNYSDASTLAQSIIEDDTSNIEITQVSDTKDYTIMTSGTLSTTNLESCDASMSHVISTISTLSGGVCLDEVSLDPNEMSISYDQSSLVDDDIKVSIPLVIADPPVQNAIDDPSIESNVYEPTPSITASVDSIHNSANHDATSSPLKPNTWSPNIDACAAAPTFEPKPFADSGENVVSSFGESLATTNTVLGVSEIPVVEAAVEEEQARRNLSPNLAHHATSSLLKPNTCSPNIDARALAHEVLHSTGRASDLAADSATIQSTSSAFKEVDITKVSGINLHTAEPLEPNDNDRSSVSVRAGLSNADALSQSALIMTGTTVSKSDFASSFGASESSTPTSPVQGVNGTPVVEAAVEEEQARRNLPPNIEEQVLYCTEVYDSLVKDIQTKYDFDNVGCIESIAVPGRGVLIVKDIQTKYDFDNVGCIESIAVPGRDVLIGPSIVDTNIESMFNSSYVNSNDLKAIAVPGRGTLTGSSILDTNIEPMLNSSSVHANDLILCTTTPIDEFTSLCSSYSTSYAMKSIKCPSDTERPPGLLSHELPRYKVLETFGDTVETATFVNDILFVDNNNDADESSLSDSLQILYAPIDMLRIKDAHEANVLYQLSFDINLLCPLTNTVSTLSSNFHNCRNLTFISTGGTRILLPRIEILETEEIAVDEIIEAVEIAIDIGAIKESSNDKPYAIDSSGMSFVDSGDTTRPLVLGWRSFMTCILNTGELKSDSSHESSHDALQVALSADVDVTDLTICQGSTSSQYFGQAPN